MFNRLYTGVRAGLGYPYLRKLKGQAAELYSQYSPASLPTYSRSFYTRLAENSSTKIISSLKGTKQLGYFHSQTSKNTEFKPSVDCLCRGILAAGLVGALGFYLYWSNTKKPVIAKSILKTHPRAKDLLVVDSHEFSSAGSKLSGGRSQGHKVERLNPVTKELEYFYYKEVIDRKALLNELVVGGLARELCGPEAKEITAVRFPLFLLHETALNDAKDHSRYAVLSESVGTVPHSDIEAWAQDYFDDHEFVKFKPKHLGVAVAFDALVGKSDCKLANLVGLRDSQGYCYSIDHESAFAKSALFIEKAEDALGYIGEFRQKSLAERGHEENCPGLDIRDDPNQPLKSRFDIQTAIRPILLRAVQNDIDNGKIAVFYKKFALLSDEKLKKVIGQYGLLTEKEEFEYFKRLKEIQRELRQHIKHSLGEPEKNRTYFKP